MNIKIYLGDSICTNCGKRHKKVVEIDGKPYGSECAKDILGKNLDAPPWLYAIAERYIVEESTRIDYTYLGDIGVNFFNEVGQNMSGKGGTQKLYYASIKVDNKTVKKDWQFEIQYYIGQRYMEITKRKFEEFDDGDFYKKKLLEADLTN